MTPEFHYRSVIGKLNFLEKSTRPDISVSVHQCARFSERPMRSHAEAVKRMGHYLLATKDKGLLIHPNEQKFFECWVDSDFSGNWRQGDAHTDPMTAKSRSGWIVHFAGAPITWASKIQTITALSTTEAEYIALSPSLREVIPLMGSKGYRSTTYPQKGVCIMLIYINDMLIVGKREAVNEAIQLLQQSFEVKPPETFENYLGVQVIKTKNGEKAWLGQPTIMKRIEKI